MSSNRNRTVRKNSVDEPQDYSLNAPLASMLETEAGLAYKKPWHRLEPGLRLNRLRFFVEKFALARSLKPTESASLLQVLKDAFYKKLLNSKTSIIYDIEKEEIVEIKPLIMHQNAQGECLFKLVEPRKAVTFRKRPELQAEEATNTIVPETA
jgi:hypothetical protein